LPWYSNRSTEVLLGLGLGRGVRLARVSAEPAGDGAQRRTGLEDLGDALFLEGGTSASGMTPPPNTRTSPRSRDCELLDHPGEQGEVRAGEQRQPDGVGVLLEHGLGDLLGRLVEPV
jgi:hypothetical protein